LTNSIRTYILAASLVFPSRQFMAALSHPKSVFLIAWLLQ
jgi:hypothetical protein